MELYSITNDFIVLKDGDLVKFIPFSNISMIQTTSADDDTLTIKSKDNQSITVNIQTNEFYQMLMDKDKKSVDKLKDKMDKLSKTINQIQTNISQAANTNSPTSTQAPTFSFKRHKN